MAIADTALRPRSPTAPLDTRNRKKQKEECDGVGRKEVEEHTSEPERRDDEKSHPVGSRREETLVGAEWGSRDGGRGMKGGRGKRDILS